MMMHPTAAEISSLSVPMEGTLRCFASLIACDSGKRRFSALLDFNPLRKRAWRERFCKLELAFDSKLLRDICEDEDQAKLDLGPEVAEALKHRLADLRAAKSARDLLVGQPRLVGDGKEMVVDLTDGHRMVLKPNHPLTGKNAPDWETVNRIKILRIETNNA
jgi:hypothetical protein